MSLREVRIASDETQIVEALRFDIRPDAVILCGSRATGDARATSDYDVLVVLPTHRIPLEMARLSRIGNELSQTLGAPVSVNPLPRFRPAAPWPQLPGLEGAARGSSDLEPARPRREPRRHARRPGGGSDVLCGVGDPVLARRRRAVAAWWRPSPAGRELGCGQGLAARRATRTSCVRVDMRRASATPPAHRTRPALGHRRIRRPHRRARNVVRDARPARPVDRRPDSLRGAKPRRGRSIRGPRTPQGRETTISSDLLSNVDVGATHAVDGLPRSCGARRRGLSMPLGSGPRSRSCPPSSGRPRARHGAR